MTNIVYLVHMNLLDLPLDIKLLFCISWEIWRDLALYDDEIYTYTAKYPQEFVRRFTVTNTHFNGSSVKLFNKYHSINDEPAYIQGETKYWYYSGRYHRVTKVDGITLPAEISASGTMYWYQHDHLHRDEDLPSIIRGNYQIWYKYDKKHRSTKDKYGVTLPAVVKDNVKKWYRKGKKHSYTDNGVTYPAVVYNIMRHIWYRNGKKHRDDDLPAVMWPGNSTLWYQYGVIHRPGDVAEIHQDNKRFTYKWVLNGEYHRDERKDGKLLPAIKQFNIDTGEIIYEEYHLYGEQVDEHGNIL